MTIPQKSGSKRIPQKKALLIGIDYIGSKSQELLDLPQDDVFRLKQFLIDTYGYSAQNITLVLDKPGEIQPTTSNIRQQAANLVAGATAGDHFFFYYAGHSVQIPQIKTEEPTEKDGKDEVIVTSDGRTDNDALTRNSCLVDNELKRLLVNPLPEGSSFMAVLDTCHSASLLGAATQAPEVSSNSLTDLDHDVCNGEKCSCLQGVSVSFHPVRTSRVSPTIPPAANSRPSISRKMELRSTVHPACARNKRGRQAKMPGHYGPIQRCQSPEAIPGHMPLVTCLSACKDDQVVCENKNDKNGASFTERLLNILRENPHPRLKDLMTQISVSIHGMLLDVATIQQLHKCQDPQMSSGTEMNMDAYLETL